MLDRAANAGLKRRVVVRPAGRGGSKPGTHHKLAIGPWPSTSRRDVAEAAWKFDPQTIEVQRVEARPVDADEYVEPRLTTAERRAMERRRWLLRGPAVLSFPEDLRR